MTADLPLLLLVDDEQGVRDMLGRFGAKAGYQVVTCAGGREAIDQLKEHPADLALVDLRMPDVGGLDVLRAIKEAVPACEVILMTGFAAIDSAVEAIKLGAMDYLTKPLDLARLGELLAGVREERERRRRLLAIESDLARRLEFAGMIGRSPVMQQTFELIRRLAPHVRTVLITGETGTGKELVARALHQEGPRHARRFVTVNCSAVVETLFESELFGHLRGAFTGATADKPGLFEAAHGGTIFLDEVGELPLAVQAKLLRTLESGEVQRVGSLEPRRVDVHVIAATNRDLQAEAAAGRFRSDLYFRLNVVPLHLPPLRDRREDISYLSAAFVRDFAARLKKPIRGISAGAERDLLGRRWEGNVRELRNVLERACILAEGEFITERNLDGTVVSSSARPGDREAHAVPAVDDDRLVAVEREQIVKILEETRGNKKLAAKVLGVSRRALYRKLEQHQLDQAIKRRPR